jgi:hypothetical protein
VTVICRAVKPDLFRDRGVLEEGIEVEVLDRDSVVPLTGAVLRNSQNIADRQSEIDELCRQYIEKRCPVAGTDGMLESIVPALFTYRDRREEFETQWKKLVAKNKRRREGSTMPPEFVAAVEMLAHLMGVGR